MNEKEKKNSTVCARNRTITVNEKEKKNSTVCARNRIVISD